MRTPHAFLMCPPEYFDVSYIINPWMHGNVRKIDNALAKQQWRALYDILTDLATVRLVHPQPGSPDMVFTANAGLVLGRRFLVSRFRYPERQYEEPYFADWFMDRGYNVGSTTSTPASARSRAATSSTTRRPSTRPLARRSSGGCRPRGASRSGRRTRSRSRATPSRLGAPSS